MSNILYFPDIGFFVMLWLWGGACSHGLSIIFKSCYQKTLDFVGFEVPMNLLTYLGISMYHVRLRTMQYTHVDTRFYVLYKYSKEVIVK